MQSDAKDSQLTLEKFDIPLKGHSVAVLVNGDISAETLKSYAEVFVNNDLNYAFVGQTAKTLMMTKLVLLKLIAASSTVFDSVIVLSDGKEMLPTAIDFVEMSYNHKTCCNH